MRGSLNLTYQSQAHKLPNFQEQNAKANKTIEMLFSFCNFEDGIFLKKSVKGESKMVMRANFY